jgi:hypothetical protein
LWSDTESIPLGAIFPEVAAGFEVLVGNPPYAALTERDDREFLAQQYDCMKGMRGTLSANCYPLFIEMMWRLTSPGKNSSALVVPLSIAYHGGEQFRTCRRAMASHGGCWRFAFFDREPHALFGEDVKTRNAILLRSEHVGTPRRGEPAKLETGPLRKWTSRTRDRLFDATSFIQIGSYDITDNIPKLNGEEQVKAFQSLIAGSDMLRTFWKRSTTCLPFEASRPSENPRVFLAGTAYNFLNLFRSLPMERKASHPLSENKVHCFESATEEDADLVFAILSSRVAFWLWQVHGDGFHVGRSFAETMPFGRNSFDKTQIAALSELGRQMWASVQQHRIVSLNKGRRTIAFRPLACGDERDRIDAILIEAARIPAMFAQTLRQFVQNLVVVDQTDQRRNHLKSLFNVLEKTS